MARNEGTISQAAGNNGIAQGAPSQTGAGPQIEDVKVNNPALLARYAEAATLAQERLLAYLSGVLGERGIQGEVRGWDVAIGVIMVATEPGPADSPAPAGRHP